MYNTDEKENFIYRSGQSQNVVSDKPAALQLISPKSVDVQSYPQTDNQSLPTTEAKFLDENDISKSTNPASVSSRILEKSEELLSGRPDTLHVTPQQLIDTNIYFPSGSSNSMSPQNLVTSADVASGRHGHRSDVKPVPPRRRRDQFLLSTKNELA